jgi:small subunit ribosomal protein S6
VHPSVPEEEIDQISEVVIEAIRSDNGEVLKMDKWGKRKLAYEVQKERYGYYVYLYFKASGKIIKEMDRRMKLHEKIIRHLTVRTDEKSAEELKKEIMAKVTTAPEPVAPEQVQPEQVKPEPVQPEQVKPEQVKPEQVKPEPAAEPEPVTDNPPETSPDSAPDTSSESDPTNGPEPDSKPEDH